MSGSAGHGPRRPRPSLAGYSCRVTSLAFIHRRVRPLDGWMVVANPYHLPRPPTLGDTCKRSLSTRGPTPSSPSHSHPPPLPLPSFWYCILFWHSGKCGGTYCGTAYFETNMLVTNGCNILTHLLDVTASDMVSGIWLCLPNRIDWGVVDLDA